jgi:hypothetical protein
MRIREFKQSQPSDNDDDQLELSPDETSPEDDELDVAPQSPDTPVAQPVPVQNTSMGLSLASLILGIIASLIGLFDLALVSDGTYDYILESEIGLLAILSFTSLGFGIAAKSKQQRLSVGALSVSIIAVVIFIACTTYSVPTY